MIEDEIKNSRVYKQINNDAMPQKKVPNIKPIPKLTGTVNPPVKVEKYATYKPGVPNRVMEKKPIQRKKPR